MHESKNSAKIEHLSLKRSKKIAKMKKTQSLVGYIYQNLESIEEQIRFSVRHEAIVERLADAGYKTTLETFRNALYRARKKQNNPNLKIKKSFIKKENKEIKIEKPTEKNEQTNETIEKPTKSVLDVDLTGKKIFKYERMTELTNEDFY